MQEQDNQHLDEIIKSSFEKRSKGAPDNLWGKLSSAMDADVAAPVEKKVLLDPLDRKVKESFSVLNERAPRHVWPAINRQLNIDRVWQGISSELDKTRTFYWTGMRMAAAILLLLLSGAGAYVMLDDYIVDQPSVHPSGSVAAEVKESSEIEQSTAAGLGLAEKESQTQLANAKDAASREKPVSSVKENTFNNSLISEEKAKAKIAGRTSKELPAAVHSKDSFDSLQTSKEGIAKAYDVFGQNQKKGVSGLNKVSKAKVQPAVAVNDSNAKAAAYSEIEGFASKSSPEQIRLNALAGSRDEISVTEKGSLLGATGISDEETVAATRASRAALVSSAHVLTESEDAQDVFSRAPHFIKGISFTLEVNKGIVDVQVVPVDTTASHQEILAHLMEEQAREQLNKRRFEAGPVMAYHNSWLLNNETKSSYDKSSLIATDPTYKQNWGLVLNYYMSRKSLVTSEVHMSRAGQQYKMYQQGEYLIKGLELRYYKLYVQYQRNFLEYGKTVPSWLTVKAGAYGGYLYEKRGELRQEESQYAQLDYGVKLALGQETDLGMFILGYGVSAERGLNNVFRGTERLPAEFNKTYLLNFGSYINLRYSF